MGIFSAIGSLFGGGGDRDSNTTTSTASTVNDDRIGVSDNGVLVQAGATLDASDRSSTSLTVTDGGAFETVQALGADAFAFGGEALEIARRTAGDSLEANATVTGGALGFAADALEAATGTAERSALEASARIAAAHEDATAALERVTGESLENGNALALATLEAGGGFLETVLAANADAAADARDFAGAAVAQAAAVTRDGSEALQSETINLIKTVVIAGTAAVAFGMLK